MTREEFEAVLALEGELELRIARIRRHRGKKRYAGWLRHKEAPPWGHEEVWGKTETSVIDQLVAKYIHAYP